MRATNALLPGGGFNVDRLLSPEQALSAYFARADLAAPASERVPLADARGRVLAERIVADREYPQAARSTMDGFAIGSAHSPGTFTIAGEIRMGAAWPAALEAGTAMRIPTGGVVPAGADAVVPIEEARVDGERVSISAKVDAGECVVPAGADMRADEPLLEAGRSIGAAEMGVLATLGVVEVPVFCRPLFAVLSSGDELVEPQQSPLPSQVRDSNRYAVAAALELLGARVLHLPIVPDDAEAYETALRDALARADGIALTGGSSVGARDLTPAAIAALGKPGVIVHGLRVKPGKPTVLAAVGGKPILGLPGNPASALMILTAVAAPIVSAMVGARRRAASVHGVLAAPFEKRPGWTWFVPVSIDEGTDSQLIRPIAVASSSVSLLARADGFCTFDETVTSLPAGAPIRAVRFLDGGTS